MSLTRTNVVTPVTADYTVNVNDDVVVVDTTSAETTVTLPSLVGQKGRRLVIVRTSAGANDAIVAASTGSETIQGNTTYRLKAQWNTIVLTAGATTWVTEMQLGGDVTFDDIIAASLVLSGSATIGGSLSVAGITNLTGNVGLTNGLTVGTTLGVTGKATLSDDLDVVGALDVDGATTLDVTTIDDTLTVNANATINGITNIPESNRLDVDGIFQLDDRITTIAGASASINAALSSHARLSNTPTGIVTLTSTPTVSQGLTYGQLLVISSSETIGNRMVLQSGASFGLSLQSATRDIYEDHTLLLIYTIRSGNGIWEELAYSSDSGINASTLDGLDSTAFAQLAEDNIFSVDKLNTFLGKIRLNNYDFGVASAAVTLDTTSAAHIELANNTGGGVVTMTSQPTLTAGVYGQMQMISSAESAANKIVLTDGAAYGLALGAPTRDIYLRHTLLLMYTDRWEEIAYFNGSDRTATLGADNTFTGTTEANLLVHTEVTATITGVGSTFDASAGSYQKVSTDGVYTLTTNPPVINPTLGQVLYLTGHAPGGSAVTVSDSSQFVLGAATRVLEASTHTILALMCTGTAGGGTWVEIGYTS